MILFNKINMIIIRVFALCLLAISMSFELAMGQNKLFQAGVAALDISPHLGVGIVGNYGTPPEAKNIHDPLMVKAIVLDDGSSRLVMVIVDNLGLHAQICEVAKMCISESIGVPKSNIIIAATHTHSGPSAGGEGEKRRLFNIQPFDPYPDFLIRKISDAAKIAFENMMPASIGFGRFDKPEHVFNRRWYMKEHVMNPLGALDSVMMNPGHANLNKLKPAGPVDPEVAFIAIKSLEGRPLAVLANYSLHYVGGVPKHDISADYFGVFSKRISQLLQHDEVNSPFVGIMTNGTSGDINNINFAHRGKEYAAYKKMEYVANDIAISLVEQYQTLDFKEWVSLKSFSKDISLKVRKSTEELQKKQKSIKEKKVNDRPIYHNLEDIYLERVERHDKIYPDSLIVTIQAFVIGDVAISTIPFEVFAETGLELKQKNPFKNSFTIGIANGYWGYLPTPSQHAKGGYETWLTANKVQLDASEIIKEELLKALKLMK